MEYEISKIVSKILEDLKKNENFSDLIIRSKKLKKNWSDIDLSIIFKRVSYEDLIFLRECYKKWKNEIKLKLDIKILDLDDNPSLPLHFHAGYQSYYAKELESCISLCRKYPLNFKGIKKVNIHKASAFQRLATQVSKLRLEIVTADVFPISKVHGRRLDILYELLKKARICSKLAIQCYGIFPEEYSEKSIEEDIKKLFGAKLYKTYLKIKSIREEFKRKSLSLKRIRDLEKVCYEYIEDLYLTLIKDIKSGRVCFEK